MSNEGAQVVKLARADILGPRSGSRAMLVEGVDRGDLRVQLDQFASSVLEVGPLRVLEVRHLGSRVALARIPFDANDAKCELSTLTERIAGLIESDAKGMRNAWQTYVVEAYYGTAQHPSAQTRHRVCWEDDEDDGGSTLARVTGNARDTSAESKALAKIACAAIDASARRHKSELSAETRREVLAFQREQALQSRVTELEDRISAMITAHQDALDRKQERELKAEERREFIKAMKGAVESAKAMLPIALKRWGYDVPIPAHAHPFVEQINQLFEAVTGDGEIMMAIMEALAKKPAALRLFGDLMSQVQDRRRIEDARARATIDAQAGRVGGASVTEQVKAQAK